MTSRYRKRPAPHDGLKWRDHELHTYSVPDRIVRQCPSGRILYLYALATAREKREVSA